MFVNPLLKSIYQDTNHNSNISEFHFKKSSQKIHKHTKMEKEKNSNRYYVYFSQISSQSHGASSSGK
jgi:hypothetical protein